MMYEVYARICVGAQAEPDAARDLLERFHQGLGLAPQAKTPEVFARLREEAPKHKQHEPDRARYERALEAYVDGLWDVDCAIGGVSDGTLDPLRGYLFVGVRVEDFAFSEKDDLPAAATRPTWLRSGDLSPGSAFSHTLGPDSHKAFHHAAKMHQRAARPIARDAQKRLEALPVLRHQEPSWALVRWLVRV
ncbi:MAG: hypothetical protein HY909_22205 [Deltaproteobacteria bacterium]|nr:hypothetical protein [Deltaproteobacteria bacterium]